MLRTLFFLFGLTYAAFAYALMPPHIAYSIPHEDETLCGHEVTLYGYSLWADLQIQAMDMTTGMAVPVTSRIACQTELGSDEPECLDMPGCAQSFCTVNLRLHSVLPGHAYSLQITELDFALSLQAASQEHVCWQDFGPASMRLDIDGDGEIQALTDGIMILRRLFGVTGDDLARSTVTEQCTRCTPELIEAYLDSLIDDPIIDDPIIDDPIIDDPIIDGPIIDGPNATRFCTRQSDCAEPDQYCAKRIGHCEEIGFCVSRPDACAEIYQPVCGCDGQTYSNLCAAAEARANVSHRGECETEGPCGAGMFCQYPTGECPQGHECTAPGECREIPLACTLEYLPVCGCDGQTYGNECAAHAQGVNIRQEGECSDQSKEGSGDID